MYTMLIHWLETTILHVLYIVIRCTSRINCVHKVYIHISDQMDSIKYFIKTNMNLFIRRVFIE